MERLGEMRGGNYKILKEAVTKLQTQGVLVCVQVCPRLSLIISKT